MKKYAVLVMAAIAFLSTFESAEAQLLQRFRSNIRGAVNPQSQTQRPVQTFNSAPPQVRIQRPAPQFNNSSPQQLTPYSRLQPQQRIEIPQQRILVPQQQLSSVPTLNAPVPVGTPAAGSAGNTIRIVTYLDPRSGRTYQRRYLVPGNSPTVVNRAIPGQVVTGRRSIFNQPTTTYNAVAANTPVVRAPQPAISAAPSLVPPIQFSTRTTPQPAPVSSVALPDLAGPALSAPRSTAQPIAAAVDNTISPSQVETASAEVETSTSMPGTSSTGIPDLSGITVDPAPADPNEEADQDLFFNDEPVDETVNTVDATTDEMVEDLNYSVLEEVEEE